MKKVFLIQRVGQPSSAERQHADHKMNAIIAPACREEGYCLERADEFATEAISEPITSALSTAALVIADLGTPPWNQNVLVEVGFRLATGLPIVFVADVPVAPAVLPIHLHNRRILHITPDEPETSVALLRRFLRDRPPDHGFWQSDYPLIDFFVPLAGHGTARFVRVNQAAATLYGVATTDELLETAIAEADKRLHGYMPREHRLAFADDQDRLAAVAVRRTRRNVTARIPAWIHEGHPVRDQLGHVYWPVLLQHKFARDDAGLVMRVAFIDVTHWDSDVLRPREPSSVLTLPSFFRARPFEYHVFLSYNSRDAAPVRALSRILRSSGLRVWMDEDDLLRTGGVTRALLRSMANSRVIVAVLGSHGLGPWQERVELMAKLQDVLREKQPLALLLLDELHDPANPDTWLRYLPEEFRAAFRDQPRFFLPTLEKLEALAGEPRSFCGEILRLLLQAIDKSFEHDNT